MIVVLSHIVRYVVRETHLSLLLIGKYNRTALGAGHKVQIRKTRFKGESARTSIGTSAGLAVHNLLLVPVHLGAQQPSPGLA